MKECFVCRVSKPIEEFYAHPEMSDGHLNKCKSCAKKQSDDRRKFLENTNLEWREKELARHRAKSLKRNKSGMITKFESRSAREWRARNPEKYNAHSIVNSAIKTGALRPQGCEVCGEKAHAHHDDYSKPLDVRWLCHTHHMSLHTELNSERRKKEFLHKNKL